MKYFVWFLGAVGIILAIIFGSILIRNTLRSDAAKNNPTALPGAVERVKLADYKKPGVTARMTIEGPVVGEENYRQVQIDVTNSGRTAKVFSGHKGSILKQANYSNNDAAFSDFMDALDSAGFTSERPSAKGKEYAGECATGQRYVFDLLQDGQVITSRWRTTCTDIAPGTLGSLARPISDLFRLQIPDADPLISGQSITY